MSRNSCGSMTGISVPVKSFLFLVTMQSALSAIAVWYCIASSKSLKGCLTVAMITDSLTVMLSVCFLLVKILWERL